MNVTDHKKFDPEFPERFQWSLITSHKLTEAVTRIVAMIERDLHGNRNYVPGLRQALCVIADVADVDA